MGCSEARRAKPYVSSTEFEPSLKATNKCLENNIVAPLQGAGYDAAVTEGFAEAAAPSAIIFVAFSDFDRDL